MSTENILYLPTEHTYFILNPDWTAILAASTSKQDLAAFLDDDNWIATYSERTGQIWISSSSAASQSWPASLR